MEGRLGLCLPVTVLLDHKDQRQNLVYLFRDEGTKERLFTVDISMAKQDLQVYNLWCREGLKGHRANMMNETRQE